MHTTRFKRPSTGTSRFHGKGAKNPSYSKHKQTSILFDKVMASANGQLGLFRNFTLNFA